MLGRRAALTHRSARNGKVRLFANSDHFSGLSIWLNTLLNPGAVQNSSGIAISYLSYQQWSVVGGTAGGAAVALDNSKSQAFVGNAGADLFVGGDKSDLFIGADGADILQGRGGSCMLLGGTGFDTYLNEASLGDSGLDTVYDSDGSGRLVIDGQQLTGGAQFGDIRVSRDPQGHIYTQAGGGRLVIDGKFVIERWNAGQLGLTMTAAVADVSPVTGGPAILSDLQTNKNDTLYDTAGNDYISSGTGIYQIIAVTGGSDSIDAGTGQDIVFGGLGRARHAHKNAFALVFRPKTVNCPSINSVRSYNNRIILCHKRREYIHANQTNLKGNTA